MPSPTALAHRPSLLDRARREWYLTRLSMLLEDLPGRDRRAIERDLRADLAIAAQDRGMRIALTDLGPVPVLAHEYRQAQGRRLPRWWTGARVMGSLVVLASIAILAYTLGLLDAAASGTGTASGRFLWTDVDVTRTPDALAASFTGDGPLLALPLSLVVFFVAARGWRAWTSRPVSSDAAEA